MLLAAE